MSLVLEAREERAKKIKDLMIEFENKTIVILKLNTPGNDKNLIRLKFIYNIYNTLIIKEFKNTIIETAKRKSLDGDYFYYVINEDGKTVKKKTILMEDASDLGKLVDIDVYSHLSISRSLLNYEMRKCLICTNYAHYCARSKAHTLDELLNKIEEIIKDYLLEDILNMTINAIHSELDLYPKFGLVSKHSNGVHLDMDYQLFIDSTNAIKPSLEEFILYGLNDSNNPLKLKEIGKKAELSMFKATNDINTQKGLIFVLGLFLPAISKAIINNLGQDFIQQEITEVSKIIIGDYYLLVAEKPVKSHGDIVYLNSNIKGIRGEVLKGLKMIFEMPAYNEKPHENKYIEYLIHLMSRLDDTTIIYRTNLKTLNNVKMTMNKIVKNGGYTNNVNKVHKLSKEYVKRNISPGGAADMLVIKILLETLKTKYNIE